MSLDICKLYLEALNTKDLEGVLKLFHNEAVVYSPLYGEIKAELFYKTLFEDTTSSDTKLLDLFYSDSKKTSVALHFNYRWQMKNGEHFEFDCVDIFEISSDATQFLKLTIIYDTAPLRDAFNGNKR
ncbi:nuclear transport factor 2 family protein [Candidatus Uabimicrobium amorphum]|uniref:SnoaL-like domain-containing protein n=1 Tax=Uabimicrobium amorphum TaxID=2596890 RepID=A0A5S9F461_UABAM|nr:nuclear transport factor 2 family protein [Candidatus Uabimicrobium amorphum]BBM84249.1 hypothetical protein UABAM_02605 [Candidatus Uabimicrobium amorphum]